MTSALQIFGTFHACTLMCRSEMSGQLKKERVVSFHHLGAGNELSIRGRRSCVRRVPLTGMRRKVGPITAGIRAVESFDSSFELQPDAKETLVKLLSSDTFCNQVGQQPGVPPSSTMQFTGELFQPTPWSVNTKFGMPQASTQ
eukprot:jgi/Mesen1/1134/ME000123S00304